MPLGSLRRKWDTKDVLVDKQDEHLLTRYHWTLGEYVAAKTPTGKIYLHRLICGAAKGVEVDHINGNKLDNRRSNLRLCTRSQNTAHWLRKRPGSNPCTGVFFKKETKNWMAHITVNYKRLNLGTFATLRGAIEARNAAAKKYFGEFAQMSEAPE